MAMNYSGIRDSSGWRIFGKISSRF